MIYTPCKKCGIDTGRHPGCHTTCDKYLKWKEEYNKIKAKIDEEKRLDFEVRVYHINDIERTKKGHGKR